MKNGRTLRVVKIMKEKNKVNLENIPDELREAFVRQSIKEASKFSTDPTEVKELSKAFYRSFIIGASMFESYKETKKTLKIQTC